MTTFVNLRFGPFSWISSKIIHLESLYIYMCVCISISIYMCVCLGSKIEIFKMKSSRGTGFGSDFHISPAARITKSRSPSPLFPSTIQAMFNSFYYLRYQRCPQSWLCLWHFMTKPFNFQAVNWLQWFLQCNSHVASCRLESPCWLVKSQDLRIDRSAVGWFQTCVYLSTLQNGWQSQFTSIYFSGLKPPSSCQLYPADYTIMFLLV